MAVLALVASGGFTYVRDRSAARSAAPLLLAGQLEVRRAASTTGVFPTNLFSLLPSPSSQLTFLAGDADSATEVSVLRSSSTEVVLAAPSGADCLVLVDRPHGSSTWALVGGAGPVCAAADLAGDVLALAHEGSSSAPQEVSVGG